MKTQFAQYTEITKIYKSKSTMLQEGDGYTRFFICNDTNNFWLVRVLEGFNSEYEAEDGCFILERNNIEKTYKGEPLTRTRVIEIIENDDFSNWDFAVYNDLDSLINDIDGGHGINSIKY